MGYTTESAMVRVDFFKADEHGAPRKWYCTEAARWLTWRGGTRDGGKLIHDAFAEALARHLDGRLRGMVAVCLEPYHENAHPIVARVP